MAAARQTTGEGPSGVPGGHPGGQGNPLGHPGGSGRIGGRPWNTPAAARDNGPRDLGFQDGENGFNAQTSVFTAMRLLQAVRVAANLVWGGNQGDHPARQLEDAYVATHGTPKPIPQEAMAHDCQKTADPPTRRSRWTAGTGRMKKR